MTHPGSRKLSEYPEIQRKITRTLFLSQSVVSAALITTGTVNAIAGAALSGNVAWAGLPSAVLLLSAAFGALVWGVVMDRAGRRKGLVSGLGLGVLGGISAGTAIWQGSFLLFLLGMGLFGVARAVMQLGRFAAAEVSPTEERGRAIATVVLGGTVGSVAGPLLVGPSGIITQRLGLSELAGPYLAALVLFTTAVVIISIWLRPEPMEIARKRAAQDQSLHASPSKPRSISEIIRQPGIVVAGLAMIIGQVVMVMIMVITSLHMDALAHPLSSISIVFSAHTFGMFAFSIISGRLADHLGREWVIILGSLILILAGLSAGLSPSILPIAVSLFLLGLGWNFCYVAGSTLLTDHLTRGEQTRTQGFNDLFVGIASAVGSLGSGYFYAAVGYQNMGFIGAGLSILPLAVAVWWLRNKTQLSVTPG